MLLLSWNVAGRVKRLGEQAQALLSLDADILCLQETTASTLPFWEERLADAGYLGIEHGDLGTTEQRRRPLVVLTACRSPLRRVAVDDVPWPERVLGVKTADGMEVINVHSPISPKPDLVKVRTHLAIHHHLAHETGHPRILCGDLNTPRKEHSDGRLWTFARDQYGRLRPDRGQEWDHAELSLIRGLEPYGFVDCFRMLHGYEQREFSWTWPRWGGGYRLDHLLVSGLVLEDCRYEHSWREEGLSDHSPLIGRLSANI